MEILISEKIDRKTRESLSFFKTLILRETKELAVEVKNVIEKNGFIKLIVEGEDLEVFLNIIKNNFGLAPSHIDELKINPVFKAFILSIEEDKLYLDAGIIHPKPFKVYIPIRTLWSQLTYGKKENIKTILTQYCLLKDFPVEVRVINIKEDEVEAAFSDKQLQFFWEWQNLPFERVIIADALIDEIKKAVKLAEVKKDVAEIKSLSLLIHLLTCKLAISSKDLAFKLQKYLPTTRILSFTPKNIKIDC
jgi:hypothetical protein